MREGTLRKCLRGMNPQQWYEMLNGHVFFWLTADRVQTLLNARAYRSREHTVITIDTAALVAKYAPRMLLSPINSGSTIYNPRERGKGTFLPFDQYAFDERRKLRGLGNAVAEAAMMYAIPDLRAFAMGVEHRKGNNTIEVLYSQH